MSIFNGIKENDIIRIKFKELKELYSDLDSIHALVDEYLRYNMRAFLHGGIFRVVRGPEQTHTHSLQNPKEEYITIDNHLDNDTLEVYESFVDEFEILDDVPSFKNGVMGLNIVRLDNQLVVNGVPLKNFGKETRQRILKSSHVGGAETKPDNDLADFRHFIESWLMDIATDEAFKDEGKGDEE